MHDRLDAYGECRDSERTRGNGFASLSAWLIATKPARAGWHAADESGALRRMHDRLDAYGECRDSERPGNA